MKISVEKRDIILLARAYSEKDESMFREAIVNLAKTFRDNGDEELANYLGCMINEYDRCVPMEGNEALETLRKLIPDTAPMEKVENELENIALLGDMLQMIMNELIRGAFALNRGKSGSADRKYIDAKQMVIKRALEFLSSYSMDYTLTRWFNHD